MAIECPSCDGEGGECLQCNDGFVDVIGCPNAYCREVSQVATLGDMLGNGLLPVAGGVLDQSAWFIQAVRMLQRDEDKIKYERDSRP